MIRKILLALGVLLLVVFGFLLWYDLTYSMEPAQPFVVNTPEMQPRILIAYQGSDYKHQVVDAVVEHFDHAYIRGIDVASLEVEDPDLWDAIFLCHTWEAWQPPAEVAEFIHRYPDVDHLVVLTTSGDGMMRMEEVDAITTASIVEEAPADAKKVIERIERFL